MPYPLPLTRTEAYLAYKAGVIQQSDLKPSLAVPRNGIDAWLAYWTGLAADYPKREDGTPHILQEEEAYIAYLCGVINEYPEKCLRRVGAYLRYLISARWGRPDHPLNREELYLSLIKTQFIPSGDPSSDITINGTAKAAFVDVKMYGDAFQRTYTGKNLAKPLSGGSKNGISVSYDAAEDTFMVNGTCASNNTTINILDGLTFESGTDYTLTVIPLSGSVDAYHANTSIQLFTSDYGPNNVVIRPFTGESIQSSTANFGSNVTLVNNAIRAENGDKFTNFKFRIQIEKNSTYSSYEPYVGGVASPNPEYPQPIQTVTGLQKVNVRGKNLVDSSKLSIAAGGSGVTITEEPDGSFTINGTSTDRYNNYRYDATEIFKTLVGETVTISVETTGAGAWANFGLKGTGDLLVAKPTDNPKTGIVPESSRYLVDFYFANGVTFNSYNVKLQIEKGSTATTYETYSSNGYEINLGKNLFNRNVVVNGIPSATDGSIVSTSSVGMTSDYIPVMPNTDYSHTGHPLGWAVVAWYKADKSFIERVGNVTTTTSPSEAAYARVSCAQGNLGTCQFEAGEPTSYAPYFEPIELCKLGDYQDYIWKDQDQWKIHKATGKVLVDGTVGGISNPSTNRFNLDGGITDYKKLENSSFALCDQYISLRQTANNAQFNTNASGYECCINFGSASANVIRFKNTKIATSDDFADALETHPLTMYYVLAAATDTAITDQALIDQLEALVKGGSEEGTTYIKVSATEPNLPGLLYVEAAEYV